MKKLFNSRFLFILASSLVVLIGLTLGAFYLFDDEDNTFIESGYILNPLSSTSEKYFFDKDAGYKENLSSMIEFVDVDKNTVSVLKDSFLHYSDESISFLKRGAILDLGSIKGNKAVAFYNISSESVIEKKEDGYYIAASTGDIKLNNFIGRISDDKFIVVGDLSLKMAGNETVVKGDYFEVVYVEEGIVNIENKDVKFQVAAADTIISSGSHIKIDLGNKKITYDNEDVMSITAITIDGDENIEIIPKVEEEEETPQGGGNGDGEGTGTGGGSGSGDGQGDNENSGENDGEITDPQDNVIINLKDAKIGSTDIEVVFEVLNAKEKDVLKLQVVNLASGRTVDIVASVTTDDPIKVNLLTPSTKYLFMVVNEKDNAKYFQKVLETSGFGIKLEKEYATNNSLSYKVSVDKDTDITNAKLTLYKFNEETKQNEVVKTSYVDSETGEVMYEEKITYLSSFEGNLEGEHSILYEGLDSDTIYTAVLDEFSIASSNFKDIYNITLTSMTLKEVPTFTEMVVDKNMGTGSFDLSLSNIKDPDNAITSYTYMIYDKFTDELAIDPIVHKNASPLNVQIGEGKNKLKNDTNYYYKVIIEYFDNEKYIEYVTSDSIIFMMGNDPYVRVVPKNEEVKHDRIAATIYLIDNSCLVSMPGREKCGGASSTVVEISRINSLTGERIPVSTKQVDFIVNEEEIKYDLYLDGLNPGTTYNIEVRAKLNNSDGLVAEEILHTDDSKRNITTKYLSSFSVGWANYQSSSDHVVNVGTQFYSIEGANTLSPIESLDTIGRVVIKLYDGRKVNELESYTPIGEKEYTKKSGINFKEMLYDAMYDISSTSTFGLTIDKMKCLNAEEGDEDCETGKLSEYYTLAIEAYTTTNYPIVLVNNIYSYRINPILLQEGIADPILKTSVIPNASLLEGKAFPNLTNGATVVGYNVSAAFDRNALVASNIVPKKITYYVYNDKKEKLKFYILNEDKELELVEKVEVQLGEEGFNEINLYMGYGTSYDTVDEVMSRGGIFYVGYEMQVLASGSSELYPFAPSNDSQSPSGGIYKRLETEKETPSIKMNISKSTENSVIYKYEIKDPDLAIYKTLEETDYAMLYSVNSQDAVRVPLTRVPDATFNHFAGELTIDNLNKNDSYKIYYYVNKLKSGQFDRDVKLNYGDFADGDRIFEGYYDPASYNFKYEIINDPEKDNKVGIRILANETFRKRILSYKLEFTAKYEDGTTVLGADGKPVKLNKELWELTDCIGNSSSKCLYVDYTDLKNNGMKTEPNGVNKLISVKVTAYYDTGLTGYDYVVGSSEDADYKYCIMQDNLVKDPNTTAPNGGSYITFNKNGTKLINWTDKSNVPKGYYTYSLNGSQIELKNHFESIAALNNKVILFNVSHTSSGYSSSLGFWNPKMIAIEDMELVGTETFYFDSITPKVSVSQKAKLINGSMLSLSLSGIDTGELRYDGDGNYVYVETWDNSADAGDFLKTVRPEVKVKIDANNPLTTINAVIDGLKENTKYYHQVYVYIIKDGKYVYTQLFDATQRDEDGNSARITYDSNTAIPSSLFASESLSVTALEEPYGNKELNAKINLNEYGSGLAFNFDLTYILCEQGSYGSCDINEGYILKKTILQDKVTKKINDIYDITDIKDFVYGKEYLMYVYTTADYYDEELNIVKRDVLINSTYSRAPVRKLDVPTFSATREAGVENVIINGKEEDNYYIKFSVTVNDADKALPDAKYYVDIFNFDNDGVSLLGDAKDCKVCLEVYEDGEYVKVSSDYAFDARIIEKQFRITGLDADTKYTFKVYNDDLYINNAPVYDNNEELKEGTGLITSAKATYTVYTTNEFGVAIGNDITYSATPKSIIVTFLGGSSFDNVVAVDYTIGVWDGDNTSTTSGTFEIGKNGKNFEIDKSSSHWRFVIDPAGMKNQLGTTYLVNISFYVKINENDIITLTSAEVPGFEGRVIYVEDKK